ncbi:hypothetical protein [Lampropedia puyangensis]|nr:hypothetical protein [Lampropedia puyangensis]
MNKNLVLQALALSFALGVLGAVFFLYTSPELMVRLAEQLWSCFG